MTGAFVITAAVPTRAEGPVPVIICAGTSPAVKVTRAATASARRFTVRKAVGAGSDFGAASYHAAMAWWSPLTLLRQGNDETDQRIDVPEIEHFRRSVRIAAGPGQADVDRPESLDGRAVGAAERGADLQGNVAGARDPDDAFAFGARDQASVVDRPKHGAVA